MKKIICANWKMNLNRQEAIQLAHDLAQHIQPEHLKKYLMTVCPSFIHIPEVSEALAGTKIAVGAQNCASEKIGNFTGQISPLHLAEMNISSIILGHAERSSFEKNEWVKQKAKAVQKAKLLPIVCIADEKEIETKCPDEGLYAIAYEPVHAIGTGQSLSLTDIDSILSKIKKIKPNIPVLYGGSVKPSNASEILALDSVDGVLVGGAALKSESFIKILG